MEKKQRALTIPQPIRAMSDIGHLTDYITITCSVIPRRSALVEEAMAFSEKSGEEKNKPRKEAIVQLLNSLRGYLTSGMWGLSRAETLISGVPPSPHLKHLL